MLAAAIVASVALVAPPVPGFASMSAPRVRTRVPAASAKFRRAADLLAIGEAVSAKVTNASTHYSNRLRSAH